MSSLPQDPQVSRLRFLNLTSFLLVIATNTLFNGVISPYDRDHLPIDKIDPSTGIAERIHTDNARTANKYDNLITPKGTAFAIWGVIYGLLSVFVIWTSIAGCWLDGNAKRDCDLLVWKMG